MGKDRKKCYWKNDNCLKCRDLEEAECIETEGKCVWKGGECKGKKKKDNKKKDNKKKDEKKKDNKKKGCIDIPQDTCSERKDKGCTWNGSSCEFDCSSYKEEEVCTYKKRGVYCEWNGNACSKKDSVLILFSSKDCKEINDEDECTKQVEKTLKGTKKCEWEFGQCVKLDCDEITVPADCVAKFHCQWIQKLDDGRCEFWQRREMHEE